MTNPYEDKKLTLDDTGVTIRSYYFPFGRQKRLAYGDLRRILYGRIGIFTGKYKFWGGDFRYWLNLDWDRPGKSYAIALVTDRWWRPLITPDDPGEVLRILEEKTGLTAEPETPDVPRPEPRPGRRT